MASVRFEIYEMGFPYSLTNYSGQELESLQEVLDALADSPGKWDAIAKKWKQPYYFTKVTFPDDEKTGIITFMNMETQTPINAPDEWLAKFLGTTVTIEPRQFGLSPWPSKVEVKFVSVSKIRIKEV